MSNYPPLIGEKLHLLIAFLFAVVRSAYA